MLWEGRTQFHAPEIDGKVYINDFGDLETLEAGRFYRAEITEAHDYDVVARIIALRQLASECHSWQLIADSSKAIRYF